MPFITQDRRELLDQYGTNCVDATGPLQPGDLCYVYYKQMVDKWKANPRWTMAHEIKKSMFFGDNAGSETEDDFVAKELAWEVFFQLYVMPYELEKRKLNGDI